MNNLITIKTIDGEVIEVTNDFVKVNPGEFDEKWVNCPTIIDENEELWVNTTVLD